MNRISSRLSSFLPPADLRRPALLGAGLLVASWAFIAFTPVFSTWLFGDARYYENWGGWIAAHQVPYRDFNIEYPPGALPTFVAPVYLRKLFFYHGTYFFWLRVEILVFALLTLAVMVFVLGRLGVSRRRAYAVCAAAGVAPAVLGPIAFFHFDYWPAMFAVAAVAALVAQRGVLACALSDHPAARGWADRATQWMEQWLTDEVGSNGEWIPEGSHYGHVTLAIMLAYGWRAIFYVFGSFGIIWAIAFNFFYRDNPEEHKGVNQAELAHIRGLNADGSIKSFDLKVRPKTPWRRMLWYVVWRGLQTKQ